MKFSTKTSIVLTLIASLVFSGWTMAAGVGNNIAVRLVGTLISRGLTTVQPVLHGSVDFTHITGAIPSPGDEGVIYGDGKFKNASGPVRLSGAVNLSELASDGLITFDCMFLIDI